MAGNEPGKFGFYELAETLKLKVLLLAVGAAVVTWAGAHAIPAMQEAGGWWSVAALVAVPALQAVRMWLTNNTDKKA